MLPSNESLRKDVLWGMVFSNLVMYFIILSTSSTLYAEGKEIETASQAAEALRPVAGDAAIALLTLGIISVGFLAVPVMTAGAAYDVVQSFGWASWPLLTKTSIRTTFAIASAKPHSRDAESM